MVHSVKESDYSVFGCQRDGAMVFCVDRNLFSKLFAHSVTHSPLPLPPLNSSF